MSDKNIKATNDNKKPEELVDSDLDKAAGGNNFEEVKVNYLNSGGKGGAGKFTETGGDDGVSGMDLGSGR